LNRGNSGYDISVLGSPEYIYQIVENTNGAKT
jgi:hypothetical protein